MEQFNGLPLLKISVDEVHQGVDKISLVDLPAIEENWLAFRKLDQEDAYNFEQLEEQKLAGPFLIPNKPILREHPETGQRFYVVFPSEVIQEIADRFNKNLHGSQFNEQHKNDVEGVYVAENWIVTDSEKDKSYHQFNKQYPIGTWYGVVKVDNSELWTNKIKTGELQGFSVELLSGLKMAIDNAVIENHALEQMEALGDVPTDAWHLVSEEDIDDDEQSLSLEDILGRQNFRISAKPDKDSDLDKEKSDNSGRWIVRYRYQGPFDNKNRNFCRRLLSYQKRTSKLFRKEDINQMSFRSENSEFGTYSIFKYKGSYGCRHKWRRLVFFVDFEDQETRRVGAVPGVTSGISDSDARKVNPKPSRANLNKIEMSEEKLKFETIEQLSADARVVGASVDDADGTHTVDGVMYVVEGGKIVEVQAEQPATGDDAPPTDETPTDLAAWQGGVETKLAELESKLDQLLSDKNGADADSQEQFTAVKMEELLTKFKEELLPAVEASKPAQAEVAIQFSKAELAAKKMKEIAERNNAK